jgi:hypothetical protein
VHVTRRYPWEPRLAELLQSFERPLEETGAELEITYPDGSVGVWPLARHYRIEEGEDGLTTLWLRPVTGGYDNPSGDPARAFSLAATRRHGFCVDELHAEGEALVCPLPNEGRLVIRPISPERRAELDAWDSFCYFDLDDADFDALAELTEDSWYGEWE